jgi:hypothetical protein
MDAKVKPFNRTMEDLGNIVLLEHVNVTQRDQRLMTNFWVGALGGTRDPYMHTHDANMWVNFGRNQIHSPTRDVQVLRGVIGLVQPDPAGLRKRCTMMEPRLAGTKYAWSDHGEYVEATCPWGNRIRIHPPAERFGRMRLGIPYVEFPVARGTTDGIARFYREVMQVPARSGIEDGGGVARVPMGPDQQLIFRETDALIVPYDGHHIAIYVADFSGPHKKLLERGIVSEESDQWQYRFVDIVDPVDGRVLFQLEHEVRSLTHPMYGRPLVNRNPAQSQGEYSTGHDAFY